MSTNRSAQALALSVLLDALAGVRELATQGRTDLTRRTPLLESVFDFHSDQPADLYGADHDYHHGLNLAADVFGRGFGTPDELVKLAFQVLTLSGRLWASETAGTRLRTALVAARRQQVAFGIEHDYTMQSIAQAYVDAVVPLGARILVAGDPVWLTQERIAAQVRALMLTAMRAAILWRFLGGSLWSLWLRRRMWQQLFAKLTREPSLTG